MTTMTQAQSYDPEARRRTPLCGKLAARIARDGPIAVSAYIDACLHDPEHGYYVKRPVIGASGDFITAPEVSQVFGELIGLWCAVVWQHMGSPATVILAELGPGRGTLMADAMRAARVLPRFRAAARVQLVETNAPLIEQQRQAMSVAGVTATWSRTLSLAADTPAIVLGNEFLDTLPVAQFELTADGWRERMVGLDADGRLVFVPGPLRDGAPPGAAAEPGTGAIWEERRDRDALRLLAAHAGHAPLAALLIDYGHAVSTPGDTLQAVRQHRYEHPLTSPGEADVTTQVDFQALAANARSSGLEVDGPVTQAEFLGALGVAERASRLMAANPPRAGELELGVARLLSPTGMGTRFKAIGLRSIGIPPLPGLAGTRA